MNWKKIITGDVFNKESVLNKNKRFIMFVFVLFMLYITNGLILGREVNKNRALKEDLLRARTQYMMRTEDLLKLKRYPEVMKQVKTRVPYLEMSGNPPRKIKEKK